VGFTTTAQLPHPGQAEPTTQLTRAVCYDIGWPWQEDQKGEHRSVRMNWVVVTDENGSRQVRMCWRADRDPRECLTQGL
jgi:hypothetical protein